ncbi:MAG: GAF domain-containing protein, partial [Nitrospirae bacterium]
MDSQKRQWRTLFEVSKIASIINSSLEHDEIVRRAVEYIPDAIGAEAASLILKDDQGLYFHLATGEGGDKVKKIRLKMGEGVAGWVAERGEVAIVNDPYNDPRFYEGADRQSGFTTRNILCVPLMLRDELKGVVEVINRREGDFTEDDASVLKCLSNQIAISLENSRLYQEMKSTFQSMVEVLAELIELRDHYTGGHTERVKRYSLLVGERMGLSTEETEALQLA